MLLDGPDVHVIFIKNFFSGTVILDVDPIICVAI